LAQLEQKLESFHRDSRLFASLSPAALTPLDFLQEISNHNPSQANIEVDDILIVDNTVRINGTCNSFESVYQWQRLLEKATYFTSVDVEDVQKQSNNIVSFTMLLSSSIEELK
jgi:Tfp pilus assembly protein PilN